jgi:hypothetical protein
VEEVVQISAVDISLDLCGQGVGQIWEVRQSMEDTHVCVAGLAKSIGYPAEDKEAASFQGVGACSFL